MLQEKVCKRFMLFYLGHCFRNVNVCVCVCVCVCMLVFRRKKMWRSLESNREHFQSEFKNIQLRNIQRIKYLCLFVCFALLACLFIMLSLYLMLRFNCLQLVEHSTQTLAFLL